MGSGVPWVPPGLFKDRRAQDKSKPNCKSGSEYLTLKPSPTNSRVKQARSRPSLRCRWRVTPPAINKQGTRDELRFPKNYMAAGGALVPSHQNWTSRTCQRGFSKILCSLGHRLTVCLFTVQTSNCSFKKWSISPGLFQSSGFEFLLISLCILGCTECPAGHEKPAFS